MDGRHEYDMEREVRRFRPLVMAAAKRYTGRGAEFDDLVQEGYLALLRLIPLCSAPEKLPGFLKRRLPGAVRTAARREWRKGGIFLDDVEGTAKEPLVKPVQEVWELLPVKGLSVDDRRLVLMLANGLGQKDAAKYFGITQQAVSARVRALRSRLSWLREERSAG